MTVCGRVRDIGISTAHQRRDAFLRTAAAAHRQSPVGSGRRRGGDGWICRRRRSRGSWQDVDGRRRTTACAASVPVLRCRQRSRRHHRQWWTQLPPAASRLLTHDCIDLAQGCSGAGTRGDCVPHFFDRGTRPPFPPLLD